MEFTIAQTDAVDVSKRRLDACVVAGPGSGKTTVLVEYFRRLVEEGVDPLRILAITFTEKAAGNMRKKLAETFRQDSAIRGRLERAWVSTVHGFCARLLKENAVFAGVDPEFYVAAEREAWRLQQESMAAAMEEVFRDHPVGVRTLIRGLPAYKFEEAVLSAYDAMRGAGVGVDQLGEFPVPPGVTNDIAAALRTLQNEPRTNWSHVQQEHLDDAIEGAERIVTAASPLAGLRAVEAFCCNLQKCKKGNNAYNLLKRLKDLIKEVQYWLITEHYQPQRQLLLEILERFDRIYRERKRQSGALDFADLEEFAVRLLERHEGTHARVQAQFDHVLMDEFQDTNGQQAKLLQLVRPPHRFYAVGDINQSIFGFRHAEPQGFRQYRDDVAARRGHLVELVDNFRSRPDILSAVETILDGAPGIEPRSLVAGRRFDTPRPVAVEVISVPGEERVEAQWVARRIAELTGAESEFQFQDVALLVRNTEVLAVFTAAFDEAGIPYLVNRGKGFYETREVNDLTHLLRAIANPRDEVSLAAVLRSPLAGVSDEALLRLKTTGENLGVALASLEEAATEYHPDDLLKLRRFRDRLHGWRARREYVSFDRLLLAAIDDCGYPATPNIDKFLALARDSAARWSLDEFVEEMALVRDSNPREPDAPPEDSANAVKVMTVHSAKGLEFPVVFLAALHKGIDTNVPDVAFSRRYGLGARWRNPAARDDKDDLYQHALREERKTRELEESNRLLYVAMTRAEQHLVLSFSANSRKPANWAGVVTNSLLLDWQTLRDEVVAYRAPDGKTWNARLLVTDQAPDLLALAPEAALEESVEFLPMPQVEGQYDTNVTVTSLAKFAVCPREYYLAQYLGFEGRLPDDPAGAGAAPPIPASEFGSQVHKLLAGIEVPGPDPEAVRLAGVFRQSPLGRRVARAGRVEREFDFLMAVEDLVIGGQVDLWFEEGGELGIIDYKTDSVTAVEAHRRAQDYALQLKLYALAVERAAGRPPDHAWLHFLRPNIAIEVDLRPSLLESPEQTVRDFQEAQEKQQFPLNEGERCLRCQYYKDLCPSRYVKNANSKQPRVLVTEIHGIGQTATP